MDLKVFLESGGLRTLSLMGLKSTASYSLVLYLLDGIILGQPPMVANLKELSFFIGLPEESVTEALDELMYHHIIHQVEISDKSDLLALELDMNKWKSTIQHKKTNLSELPGLSLPAAQAVGENLTDLSAFRERHEIYDAKVRALASDELKKLKEQSQILTADEELLLQILTHHHQPRKQLHWALRVKLLYPNLSNFLEQAQAAADLRNPNESKK